MFDFMDTQSYLLVTTTVVLPLMGWLVSTNPWYLILVFTQIPYLFSVAFKAFPEKHNE